MRRAFDIVLDVIVLGCIGLVVLLIMSGLGWLGCTHYPPSTPVRVWEPPACIVVLGPPPSPPQSFRSLSERCRDEEGRRLKPEEPCLTAGETDDLVRHTAQVMAYATGAYYACRVAEPGLEGTAYLP